MKVSQATWLISSDKLEDPLSYEIYIENIYSFLKLINQNLTNKTEIQVSEIFYLVANFSSVNLKFNFLLKIF